MGQVWRIETERLLLREPQPDDVAAWAPFLSDPDFQRYVPVRRSSETWEERAARNLDGIAARWQQDPLRAVGWVIVRRSDGQVIGTGGVEEGAEAGDGELDYRFGKPFWGQGFGRETAAAMSRFAVEHLPFERLVAYVVPGNTGSIRIAEGLGLRFEKQVDYLQFFPDPSMVKLDDPITNMYAAAYADVQLGSGVYRAVAVG
ncbi:MAG TPA: GNAT family N-acetyltransferase [Candidatus Limnocylindrales bacterium]